MAQRNWRSSARKWLPPALLDIYRKQRGDPRADPQFTLPVRTLAELLPRHTGTVQIPIEQTGRNDEWAVPAAELLAIAAISSSYQPCRVFEIGTYTGETTRILACNTPPDAVITTLDLAPDEFVRRVGRQPHFHAGSAFRNTAEAAKIRQQYVAAHGFDFSPYENQCDMVFVDADHRYEAVHTDTMQALKLVRSGGVVVWDDYVWNEQHPECAGVTRAVNELAETRTVYRIAGTRLAIHVAE